MSTEVANALEQRIAQSVNAERTDAGLDELSIELHLNAAAQAHSDWMADTGEFSHEGENGSDVRDRVEEAEFPLSGAWRASENLAYSSLSGELDQGELDRMHEGLMNSEGHRANILDPDVAYMGIGLTTGVQTIDGDDQEVVYLTEVFADTEGEVLLQEAEEDAPEDASLSDPAAQDAPEEEEEEDSTTNAGSCFVATAAYGDRRHPDVIALRRFRAEVLVRHWAGRAFVRAYWHIGPKLARVVAHDRPSGRAARAIIGPLARLTARRSQRRM